MTLSKAIAFTGSTAGHLSLDTVNVFEAGQLSLLGTVIPSLAAELICR